MANERFDPHKVDLGTILRRLKLLDREVQRRMALELHRIDRAATRRVVKHEGRFRPLDHGRR